MCYTFRHLTTIATYGTVCQNLAYLPTNFTGLTSWHTVLNLFVYFGLLRTTETIRYTVHVYIITNARSLTNLNRFYRGK